MLKQSATYEQQIAELRKKGCEVHDEKFCMDKLRRATYFRLSAYLLPFRTANKKCIPGTDFINVYSLYEFDRKLRRLIFSMIEELEVYLQSQLSYYHTQKYGADGYMTQSTFNSRHNHNDFIRRVKDTIKKHRKLPTVKHHKKEYGGKFPLWVLIELFTFGMLSYFYSDMITADQKEFARGAFNANYNKVKSWLYCCTDLRNLCAHAGRLYYRVFTVAPAKIRGVKQENERSLFAAIMALRELYPDEFKWNYVFMPSLITIFGEHYDAVELHHIGFPEKWENILRK